MTIVGKRVKERRELLGLTQQGLADLVTELSDTGRMKQQGIASIESGASKRPRFLMELAIALETSQQYLLGRTDDPTPIPPDDVVFRDYSKLPAAEKAAVASLVETFSAKRSAAKRPASPKKKGSAKRS